MGSVLPPPPPPFISSGDSGSNYSEYGSPHPPPPMSLGFSKSSFTYEELVRATDGFSDYNILGQGGFGYVHKGMLPNGKEVAVKHLKLRSGQGECEFQSEVEIISRVHHKHLVTLVGYCSTGSQRILVYEFVPNNTMEFHLHGKGRPTMDWATILRIALGYAKGLAYLHADCHPKSIHHDIKAANILLDAKFEAKVADFRLANFSSDTNTHVSTRPSTCDGLHGREDDAQKTENSRDEHSNQDSDVQDDIGIATGNWGCGAFGGDPEIKAITQWLADSQALRPFISYYTFGEEPLQSLEQVSRWIMSHGWTVGKLWNMLVEYSTQRVKCETRVGFFSWLLPILPPPLELSELLS